MTRFRNSLGPVFAWVLVACWACDTGTSRERREFDALEAGLGTLADAPEEDRAIRIEQVEALNISSKRLLAIKQLCTSSYRSFNDASRLLAEARRKTHAIESEIKKARQRQSAGESLPEAQAAELRTMSGSAAAALESVTKALNTAETLVTQCENQRTSIRFELAGN